MICSQGDLAEPKGAVWWVDTEGHYVLREVVGISTQRPAGGVLAQCSEPLSRSVFRRC